MKTFLICPVRGHDTTETENIVKKLENDGYSVHWPPRDTNQNDDTGYKICKQNLMAIMMSNVVHFVWNGESQGCLFDLGMAFALGKKVIPISMPDKTDGKSFQNMVTEWVRLNDLDRIINSGRYCTSSNLWEDK